MRSLSSVPWLSAFGAGALLAAVAQAVRWLRVLQREHYAAGSVWRFYRRWSFPRVAGAHRGSRWSTRRPVPVLAVALVSAVVLLAVRLGAVAVGLMVLAGLFLPRGLTLRGRTSSLAWTRRLRTVAGVLVLLTAAVVLGIWWLGEPWVAMVAGVALSPVLVDGAAWLTKPLEERLALAHVARARERLAAVRPTVVAITGSFGKTSTKHHLAELLGGYPGVVPTPRSFNNRAGLSRAINENLASDTTVFIAEMGTYGRGEIADLCAWCPPDVAVVTAIGPVHLERMRTLETIEMAKHEITERAPVVVLNVDDERLRAWVPALRAAGKVVHTGATAGDADVVVTAQGERWRICVAGEVVAVAPPVVGVRESNLAVAIATARALGRSTPEIVARISHLTAVANRMVVATAPSGVMVIDDTFNANPQGARSALATLGTLPINGRRVVVTPGIIELGERQHDENVALAAAVLGARADLVIVGRTNATALMEGFGGPTIRFDVREEAVAWVRSTLRAGDGVLYLNDLPDHYP